MYRWFGSIVVLMWFILCWCCWWCCWVVLVVCVVLVFSINLKFVGRLVNIGNGSCSWFGLMLVLY